MAVAFYSHDWTGCDPETCALPVDSDDQVGASAALCRAKALGRNRLVMSDGTDAAA